MSELNYYKGSILNWEDPSNSLSDALRTQLDEMLHPSLNTKLHNDLW